MEGKFCGCFDVIPKGEAIKTQQATRKSARKINPSLSLRVFGAKKGKQKLAKWTVFSWITMAIHSKTLKTSPEELLLRGMRFVV